MNKKTGRGTNYDAAAKILLLLGFADFFLITVSNGSARLYVHPRIIPFMIFASVVMITISVFLLGELFNQGKKKAKLRSLVLYIIPLILAFTVPAAAFDSGDGPVGDISVSGISGFKNTAEPGDDINETEPPKVGSDEAAGETADQQADVTLIMDENSFYYYLNEIYSDIDKYEGRQIEVVGFVYKDSESFGSDEFVPARLMMVCCAADMMPAGLLCRFEDAAKLTENSWVKVTGTIAKIEYEGGTIPCIKAETVSPVEEPNQSYIYPY